MLEEEKALVVEDGLVGKEGERGGVRRGKGVPERLAMLVNRYGGGEVRGCVEVVVGWGGVGWSGVRLWWMMRGSRKSIPGTTH